MVRKDGPCRLGGEPGPLRRFLGNRPRQHKSSFPVLAGPTAHLEHSLSEGVACGSSTVRSETSMVSHGLSGPRSKRVYRSSIERMFVPRSIVGRVVIYGRPVGRS